MIITRDRRIQEKVVEINAVRDHGAKMVNFASDDAASTWGQLEVFMARWREIELLVDAPGPFIHVISRTGKFRAINLGL